MKQFTQRSINKNHSDSLHLGSDRGSVSKGVLLGIICLVLGTVITLYFISPSEEPINQDTPIGSVEVPPQGGVVLQTPPPINTVIPETILEVEYSISYVVGEKKQPNPQQIRYLQAGDLYARRESSPNYSLGRQELVVRNEEDQWIANLFTKSARHMNFAGPMMSRGYPIPAIGFKGLLNFGEEIQFFIRNNATQKIEGGQEVYSLSSDNGLLNLFVDIETKTPRRLEYKGQGVVTELNISKYNSSHKFDKEMFTLPKDIRVLEIGANQTPVQFRRWLDEDPRILGYYKSPNSEMILDVLKEIKWQHSFNSRVYLGSFFGSIMSKRPELIKEVMQIAKNSEPEVQLIVANALRSCRSEECLRELRSNPFSFSQEGIQKFSEIAEKEAQGSDVIRGPDGLVASFLVSGDMEHVNGLLKLFDEQMVRQGESLPFTEHVKEYARLLKRLSRDNETLEKLISEKASVSKTAKLALEADDRFGEAAATVPGSLPSVPPSSIK